MKFKERKPKVLVVDDDRTLLQFLEKYLGEEGYDVRKADRGARALKEFYAFQPELVILDLMMPGMDGWELCARIRELSDAAIIVLSAKSAEEEKLRGFRLGVDDYVTKPFSMAELAARAKAVLSRSGSDEAPGELVVGPLRILLKRKEVFLDGEQLPMTPTEYRLLVILAERAGETVLKEELHERMWGDYSSVSGTALRRYIWLLRQKIEQDPADPRRLVTVRGFGYRLEL